jgi:8-oxo-dGTP pyrophosphatase MutT (NUDIX family)
MTDEGGRVAVVRGVGRRRESYWLPGGGCEPGESPEDAITREVAEELGRSLLAVEHAGEAVQLFFAEDESRWYRMEAAFLRGVLGGPTEAVPEHQLEWVEPEAACKAFYHACHAWAVREFAGSADQRADVSDIPIVQKAVACLVRQREGSAEVLVFQHPTAGVQLPKGTLEIGEDPWIAVLREMEEESGVSLVRMRAKIGEIPLIIEVGSEEAGRRERQVWHVYWLEPINALPEGWDHTPVGGSAEVGLVFSYRWLDVRTARSVLHARYHQAMEALEHALGESEH